MPIVRTRPISDPLSALEQYIQQSEQAGAGLTSVVAGTVQGTPFNVVTFIFEPKTLPPVTLKQLSDPIDTDEQQSAVESKLVANGLTPLFFAPVFADSQQVNIAVCRAASVSGITPPASPLSLMPSPNPPAKTKKAVSSQPFTTDSSHGSYRGSSSNTSGLHGTESTFSDGTIVIDAQEELSAIRGTRNFGSKTVAQRRAKQGNSQNVQQANYSWLPRTLQDALLIEGSAGFPSDVQVVTGKATQFGKHDPQDEGTGSELLKVVQTNSDVFGASLKLSRLVAIFGSDLRNSTQLLAANVEIFNPKSGRFARVPIVDVGPAEHLSAEIDLTLALDQFLKTDGRPQVQFRVVV